jgi:hypothetical protein
MSAMVLICHPESRPDRDEWSAVVLKQSELQILRCAQNDKAASRLVGAGSHGTAVMPWALGHGREPAVHDEPELTLAIAGSFNECWAGTMEGVSKSGESEPTPRERAERRKADRRPERPHRLKRRIGERRGEHPPAPDTPARKRR